LIVSRKPILTGPRYTGEVITGGTVSGLQKDFMHAEGYMEFSIAGSLAFIGGGIDG
jgi:hypothetical protein